MYFKTLSIEGFKSFPDKTVLTFDNRTTAVVGSNGNGKSNISDALRWVMGEQGAKTLRGDKMEDVIFFGTQTRKPMGFAKVSLTIDNTDRRLPVDADEVVITRKLYRTGDSEYLINGAKSRLKDVHTLFMGTGLGRDGYSIIGQGRIEEIINSKAAGRREVFEEAAGVSKFLHKKATAERELERTQENLLRLLDIELELQQRIPVLEKQAGKAKIAFSLKEEEKNLGVALSVRELAHISKDIEEADNTLLLNQGQCEHFDREITQHETQIEQLGEEKREISAAIDKIRRQGEEDKDRVGQMNTAIEIMKNDIGHNNGRISAIKEQIELSEKSDESINTQIQDLRAQIAAIIEEIAQTEQTELLQSESLAALDTQNTSLDEENRTTAEEIGRLYTSKSAAEIYISRAQDNIKDLDGQLEHARSIIDGQADEKAALAAKNTALRSELDELVTEKEETANKLGGYSKLYESKAAKLDEAKDTLENIKKEHHAKKTRFDVLGDVERSMAGYHTSVKSVMQAVKSGRFSAQDIRGTVADIIKIDKQYATAVEIALGGALQHIIVSNEAIAKRAISFLKETGAGRATFLPLTSIKGSTLDNPDLYKQDGFVGLGHEIVGCDEQYAGIIKSLLGRTAFAEDIDCATLIAKNNSYKFKLVTLDGQVINAGGSYTGGSVKKSEGIIGRKHEIDQLKKQLDSLTAQLEPAKIKHDLLAAECAKMKLECEGMSENLVRFAGEELRLNAEISGIGELLESFGTQLENSQATLERCQASVAKENEIIGQSTAELARIAAELSEKEQSAFEKSKLLEDIISRRREITEAILQLGLQKLAKNKDIENLNSQITNLDTACVKARENRGALLEEITAHEAENAELESQIILKQNEIAQTDEKLSAHKSELSELTQKSELYEKRRNEIHAEIREKISHKEKFSNAHAAAIERKLSLERKSADIIEALWNDFELTPSEASELAGNHETIDDIKSARTKLNEIRRKLTALGDVNYAAITEFTEVSARYKELSGQLDDVRSAKAELERLIAELTQDIRTRFLESFNDINRHFSRIFTEIFGGGTARLELTNEEDVLSGGIEIFAAPPGKVINNLIALSGGEKALVAITLYFAILLHRPTPFCMLDEVDAALDELNVTKYINYLKRYADTTQLMMITHRRPTIEGCDVLYGVFMQEKGVSRLLKQEIG
jgi:chromosome segregation protein